MEAISKTTPGGSEAELLKIAAELIWWQEPATTLGNRPRFIAQLMRFGTWDEVQRAKDACGWQPFRDVLDDAPPGLFDLRSWNYWHGFFGLPVLGLPIRKCFADMAEEARRSINAIFPSASAGGI